MSARLPSPPPLANRGSPSVSHMANDDSLTLLPPIEAPPVDAPIGRQFWGLKTVPEKPALRRRKRRGPQERRLGAQGRKVGMRILALVHQGYSNREICRQLRISRSYMYQVTHILKRADEWVQDSAERLDTLGVPMAVNNVLHGLEKRDKTYSLAVLRGRGVLDNMDQGNRQTERQVLAVKIEMPSGAAVTAVTGVGSPSKELEERT